MNGFDVVIRCGMRRGIDGKEEIMYLKGYLEIVHRGGRKKMSEIPLSTVTLQEEFVLSKVSPSTVVSGQSEKARCRAICI